MSRWIWEWRCCGWLWELIPSRRFPEPQTVEPKCPTCGSSPKRQWVDLTKEMANPMANSAVNDGYMIVNLRDYRGQTLPADVVRIDRMSRWGNPYRMARESDRDSVIASYRRHLGRLLAEDPALLDPLIGKRLACWCAPKACHGDVIAEELAERVIYLRNHATRSIV